MRRFWSWQEASEDTGGRAVLVLSGVIDTGMGWYEDTVTPQIFRQELDAHAGADIQVEINSPGGDVFAGFEIYNMLRSHAGRVSVRVVGNAASAASMVAMAADPGELAMCEMSMMMIHNPWTCVQGNSDALREQADVLDMILDVMVACYMHRYKGSEDALRAELAAETWLTPERALERGLCDSVETPEEDSLSAAAAAAHGRYAAMSREDMDGIRARYGIPRKKAAEPAGDLAGRLLDEADAIIAAAFTL